MANQRTADLLIGAFKDEMSTRRKYELVTPNGTKIDYIFHLLLDLTGKKHSN